MTIHAEPSSLAGTTVIVDIGNGTQEYRVEDYWDRVSGGSWMWAKGNPAALNYAVRTALAGAKAGRRVPLDDEVLYGKIGSFGHLVHVSEVQGR